MFPCNGYTRKVVKWFEKFVILISEKHGLYFSLIDNIKRVTKCFYPIAQNLKIVFPVFAGIKENVHLSLYNRFGFL